MAYKFYNKEREIIQAAQNDTDEACIVQEKPCMTKEEILSGFDESQQDTNGIAQVSAYVLYQITQNVNLNELIQLCHFLYQTKSKVCHSQHGIP